MENSSENKFVITKKAGIYGIIGNVFLLLIKGLVGFLTKSQAMIADSINSAGDIFASLMTFIGNKIASAPRDEDHKNDMIITTFTLISVVLSLFGIYFFDSVVGIGISIWICFTGVKIFVESYNVLMDISVDDKTKKDILDITHSFKEIKNVDDIISTPVGDKYLVFITIYLDGNMSTFESHTLADNLEKAVTKLDKIYKTVVHVEPV